MLLAGDVLHHGSQRPWQTGRTPLGQGRDRQELIPALCLLDWLYISLTAEHVLFCPFYSGRANRKEHVTGELNWEVKKNGHGEEETPYTSVFQFLTAQDQLNFFNTL